MIYYCYVITRLISWEGWYRKSTNRIARLPVWYFPSITPVPCISDRKSNFSKWRMRRRSRFANFILETQSNSCPGDEGPQFELGLDMWNNLGRPEEAAEHENGSWASRFYRRTQIQFNTVRKTTSIWHEALWYNDELDKRSETTVSIIVVQGIRRVQ